jgi:hypothetical protein
MVPRNKHLTWTRITDFSPGLWNRDKYSMPPNAAQTMQNCFPSPAGGLEPWLASTQTTHTGVGAGDRIIGVGYIPGWTTPYLLLAHTPPNTMKLWRGSSFGTWTLTNTFASAPSYADCNQTIFVPYANSAGTRYAIFNIDVNTSDDGIWSIQDSGVGLVRIGGVTNKFRNLTVHQARIVVVSLDNTVSYTDPGGTTFPGANTIQFRPDLRIVTMLAPIEPSDLIVGGDGALFNVQGDMSDPSIRKMADFAPPVVSHNDLYRSGHVFSPLGLAYLSETNGVFVTSDGSDPQKISNQLVLDWNQPPGNGLSHYSSDINFQSGFLVTGDQTTMYVLDTNSRAWFTTTHLPLGQHRLQVGNTMHAFTATAPISSYGVSFASLTSPISPSRCNQYTWKSAPLHAEHGRQVNIREVEVAYRTADSAGNAIAVTVGNSTQTVSTIAANTSGIARYPFDQRGEYLDVQVVPTGGSTSAAPTIEEVAIGWKAQHLL